MTISAQAAESMNKLEEAFNKGTMLQKAAIKAATGLATIMGSGLDKAVKVDAIMSTVEMLVSLAKLDALSTILECHAQTKAPIDLVLAMMTLKASDDAEKRERLFATMMQLFVDEADKLAAASG